MNTTTIIEAVGYLGSALVLVSFLMSSVVKLRIVNTVGSVIFAIYALIIRSYPTAVMNFALVCINLHFLWKLRRTSPSYRLLELQPGEGFVRDFLKVWGEDIARIFPSRDWEKMEPNRVYVVMQQNEPAGILLAHEQDGVLNILLDYSTPEYRDCSVGAFLLEQFPSPLLIRYSDAEAAHLPYLQRLGFTEHDGTWEKQL